MMTAEQEDIIGTELGADDCLKVIAFAGTGKTFTLQKRSERYPVRTLYAAFNKSVQEEASRKFPRHVNARTLHSLAWAAEGRMYGSKGFVGRVNMWQAKGVTGVKSTLNCALVIDILEGWLNSADEEVTAQHMPPKLNDDLPKLAKVAIPYVNQLWKAMVAGKVQMTHSGYLKLYQLSKPQLRYECVLLDEAQDTNPVSFDVLKRREGSLILVGDPYQQIYAWRGAIDAMNKIECRNLYLSQSFRFGPELAEVATAVLGKFYNMARPISGNPQLTTAVYASVNRPYTLICRTNGGMFVYATDLVKSGAKISLTGGNTFQGFLQDLADLWYMWAGRKEECRNGFYKMFTDFDELESYATIRGDYDLISRINIITCYQGETLWRIRNIQENSVDDCDADVLLVTAHRAKGMEWDNVHMADDFDELTDSNGQPLRVRVPGRAYTAAEESKLIDQDAVNLAYVALTRAKCKVRLSAQVKRLLTCKPPPPYYPEADTASRLDARGDGRRLDAGDPDDPAYDEH